MRAAQITRITVGATIRIPSYGVRQPVWIGSGDFFDHQHHPKLNQILFSDCFHERWSRSSLMINSSTMRCCSDLVLLEKKLHERNRYANAYNIKNHRCNMSLPESAPMHQTGSTWTSIPFPDASSMRKPSSPPTPPSIRVPKTYP